MFEENSLNIYTDGSSAPRPRRGGVGFRMVFPDESTRDFCPPGYAGATNNEMELQAAILALREVDKLKDLKASQSIQIHTDSQYLVNNIGNARIRWPWQKWTRITGEPVLNVRQWKQLLYLKQKIYNKFRVPVYFVKVKAHTGHEHNTAADKLAKASRRGHLFPLRISNTKVRRKTTEKSTLSGSIRGEGQRIRLKVITGSYLPQQRLFRSRCEVLSKKSNYYQNVDFVFSKESMSAGHVYDIVLESGLNYCRVRKIIREILKK